jgi:heme iron utilization protein
MADESFDPKTVSRRLLRESTRAALATIRPDGFPFASLVTVATQQDGSPVLLLSRLAVHTRNLEREARASLLLASEAGSVEGDSLASARLTLVGRVRRLEDSAKARRRFLARHPEASFYAGFADFAFWRLDPAHAHLVAGFGRIVDLDARELLIDLCGAEAIADLEEGAIKHMNEDHSEAIQLMATRLLGEKDGRWRMVGLDPAGAELALDGRVRRLDFPDRVTDGSALRATLKRLTDEARGGK